MAWDVAILVCMSIISFVFAFLAVNMKKDHWMLQIFFLFVSMYGILTTISLGIEIAETNMQEDTVTILTGIYQMQIVFIVFLLVYFIVLLLVNLARKLIYKKRLEKGELETEDEL